MPAVKDHSAEQTSQLLEAISSLATLATGSSFPPSLVPLWMSPRMLCASPTSSTPWRVQAVKKAGVRSVMLELSLEPVPWLALQDRASDLPIVFLGWWWSRKSKQARKRD